MKKIIGVSLSMCLLMQSIDVAFAELVDEVEFRGKTITISGQIAPESDIMFYTMTNKEKSYGIDEVELNDISMISYEKTDSEGNYSCSQIIKDEDEKIFVSAGNGEKTVVDLSQYPITTGWEIFVATTGNDTSGDGTKKKPFKTLQKAQTKVAEIKNTSDYQEYRGNIYVNFMGGTYRNFQQVEFLEEHGGINMESQVIYRSYDNENRAVFTNSKQIPYSEFEKVRDSEILKRLPVAAVGNVYRVDLSGMLDKNDDIEYSGSTKLYLNNKPQTISRWPNSGFKSLLLSDGSSAVVDAGGYVDGNDTSLGTKNIVLAFDDANPMRWENANNMMIRGYLDKNYTGSNFLVENIDLEKRQISLKNPNAKKVLVNEEWGAKHRWYAENLLEEIDIPGEYYIDEAEKVLYYYPPYDFDDSDVVELVTGSKGSHVFALRGAKYITFENIDVSQAGNAAIVMVGNLGTEHVTLDGMHIGNTAGNAIYVRCNNVEIRNCVIHNTSGSAIFIIAPESYNSNFLNTTLAELESTNVTIENNHIYSTHDNQFSLNPSIADYGVKNIIKNNTIHKMPSAAVFAYGTESEYSYNEVYGGMYNATDYGAFYLTGDLRRVGMKLEYNFIHSLGIEGYEEGDSAWPVTAIYWDKAHSGTVQNNNIIVNDAKGMSRGIFMNGGRNHEAKGNVMVGARMAFHNPDYYAMFYAKYDLEERANGIQTPWPLDPDMKTIYVTKFLPFYEYCKENNTAYYQKYHNWMDELYEDTEGTDRFFAKNLDFQDNVLVECDDAWDSSTKSRNEYYFNRSLIRDVSLGNLWDDEKGEYIKTNRVENNSNTVTLDNYYGDVQRREDVFVDSANGDYRVTQRGKELLEITGEFKLDESFNLQSIGNQNEPELGESFKKLYPYNGAVINDSCSVELVWEPALFADKYEYTVYDKNGTVVSTGKTMYTNVVVEGLEANAEYSWEVKAIYESMVYSARHKGNYEWVSDGGANTFITSHFEIKAESMVILSDKFYYDVINNDNKTQDIQMIIACYDDERRLLWCDIKNVEFAPGHNSFAFEVELPEGISGEYNTFIFSSDGNIRPLISSKIYVNN